MNHNLSSNLQKTITSAYKIAADRNHKFITIEHLLLAMLNDDEILTILNALPKANVTALSDALTQYLNSELGSIVDPDIKSNGIRESAHFSRVFQRAQLLAKNNNIDEISSTNILLSIFSESESKAVIMLRDQDVERYDVVSLIQNGALRTTSWKTQAKREAQQSQSGRVSPLSALRTQPTGGDGQGDAFRFRGDGQQKRTGSRTLDTFAINLNAMVGTGKIDPLVGRHKEVEQTIRILCRRRKNNPLYVGDPGVGKTALAEGLAHRIESGDVPEFLKQARIYSLDIGKLVGGTRFRGDFEERLTDIVNDLERDPSAILFIDEIHSIIGAGSVTSGGHDAANILKPALARGTLRCIGATTHKEARKFLERDEALNRRFQRIEVGEPTETETIEILKGVKRLYEAHHGVVYPDEIIEIAVKLSAKHITDRRMPDKAIDVIDDTGAALAILNNGHQPTIVRQHDIEMTVATMAKIPTEQVSANDRALIRDLEERLNECVFGQDEAVRTVTQSIKLARSGLKRGNKPIGNFLFAGPTGVGKTELAKRLAASLGVDLVRFDMSEYMERHTVSRLLGAPPGYVGFDQGGLLTDAINRKPHCVLLLDEIEKAHPDLYNILLQVMDNGMLTDANGRQVSFRNVILIMTTNAGSEDAARPAVGFLRSTRDGEEEEAIRKTFSPEFRNRIDQIVQFRSLSNAVVRQISGKLFAELGDRLTERGVTLHVDESAIEWLAIEGYDPLLGARPMGRILDSAVALPLADEILFGRLNEGGEVSLRANPGEGLKIELPETERRIDEAPMETLAES